MERLPQYFCGACGGSGGAILFESQFYRAKKFLLPVFGLFSSFLFVASGFSADLKVAVTKDEIQFRWNKRSREEVSISLHPIATFATTEGPSLEAQSAGAVVWTGDGSLSAASIPRFDGARDRLFAKYRLIESRGAAVPGPAQYVTDFDALPRRHNELSKVRSQKGITCLLDEADGVALGCAQLNENIDIGSLLDLQSTEPKAHFFYEGRKIGLKPGSVTVLDAHLKAAHKNGQRVTGILLNNVRSTTPASSPLVHPLTNPGQVPIGPSAFNTATDEGIFYYRAILHWLVERYTREDAANGILSGLVIGNEMQSHWSWYHLGNVDAQTVIREYSTALRVADLVARSVHDRFQIYVSLEHHWAMPASEDRTKGFSGLEAMEGIQRIASMEGNFPWCVAFHPYPESLFKPQFWNDLSAPFRFDAPRITFHNLEVLSEFLKQPEYLFEGRTRTIALTEQGFHCPDSEAGEELQAAAFALAWKKVRALPEIESFLYHRHVDHPHEHGLQLGIRAHDGSSNVNGVGRPRLLWRVFKSAGTSEEDREFAFALPIVGRNDWNGLIATKFEEPRPAFLEKGTLIYDFVEKQEAGLQENLQSVVRKSVGPQDEVQRPAVLTHPKAKGVGRLSYVVTIPSEDKGESVLLFDAFLNNEKSSGAGFRVEIDGIAVFSRNLKGGERVPVEVSLNRWRGRECTICWMVDPLNDPAYDWTTWVAPRILLR